jgi:hypothetical protein
VSVRGWRTSSKVKCEGEEQLSFYVYPDDNGTNARQHATTSEMIIGAVMRATAGRRFPEF